MTAPDPVRIGLIGAGRIGTHHATTIAHHLHQAKPVAVADPLEASARRLGEELGADNGAIDGVSAPTARRDTDLFADAYAAELAAFCAAVRTGNPTTVGGHDARAALRIALARIEAVETGTTVTIRDHDREATA